MNLETKPDYDACVARLEAWFHTEMLDRAPIRFHRHNAEYDQIISGSGHATLKERWMDAGFQAESFLAGVRGRRFNAETFPVYMPNLGPNWFAACHGAELEFGEITSWCEHIVDGPDDLQKIKFSKENPYYKNMRELTAAALEICGGQFLVGYTDLHPGMDCACAWRGDAQLCMDMMMEPEMVHRLMALAGEHFLDVYDEFDTLLKAHGQPSVTWMNIPVPGGRMHIPSNDFSTLISPAQFYRFALPMLREEVKTMTHNVFHVDGLGVARHTDSILGVEGVNCIQWVQGMGDYYPIMQHLPYIKRVQSKGASIIVDLSLSDLERFMREVSPKGIFLWVATENEQQEHDIIKRLLKWK